MPVVRYFIFVGGALLVLLFAFGAEQPKLPVAAASEAALDLPMIRIHTDRKWPEAIVFDTNVPAVTPASPVKAEAAVPAATTVAGVAPTARVRDAFAQLEPVYPKRQDLKPQPKRKLAKIRAAVPVVVAQQPRFGSLANNTW
jgi:hypothetical protein